MMKEVNSGKDKVEKKIPQIEKQRIETFDDIAQRKGIETFDDIARSNDSPKRVKTFDDIAKYDTEEQIDKTIEKTDPYWKEADERTAAAQRDFETRGDWRQEFSRDAGKEEHKKWQDEIIRYETEAGRIKGVDYDIEPALIHPDGEKVYPDYVDYKEDIIIDRKPIGKGELETSLVKKYAEQRKRHIEAYEYSTGRKVNCYVYSLYPSPKDIY